MRTHASVVLAAGLITRTYAWISIPQSTCFTSNKPLSLQHNQQSLVTPRWISTVESEDLDDGSPELVFRMGDLVQVEIVSFGPIGASVDIVGVGHNKDDLVGEDDPPLATGLILQREIHYFREGRNGIDVVIGEVLPAFIEKRHDDGKLDVSLRPAGGKAKATEISKQILQQLISSPTIALGDKSTPEEIAVLFPGVSKAAFKKAVSALYKKGIVKPGPYTITKMARNERR